MYIVQKYNLLCGWSDYKTCDNQEEALQSLSTILTQGISSARVVKLLEVRVELKEDNNK